MVLLLADLGWGGYTPGATRWYLIHEEDLDPYYAFDTVVGLSTWDGTGSRCSFSTPVERADYIIHTYSYDPEVDTGFAYYDGTYLVDLAGTHLFSFPGVTGIRMLKFPLTVGETWQAIDTCIYPLDRRVSIGYDEDMDGVEDSMYFSPSYATLAYYSGDTAEVFISPYIMTFAYTDTDPYMGDTLICCVETIIHFYLHIRYIDSIGLAYYSIDSLIGYQTYALIDTSTTPWDTTYVPPSRIANYYDYMTWTYTTTSVSETRPRMTFTPYRLNGRRLTALEDLTLYSYDGRLVGEVRKGSTVSLKPGLYFVRSRGRTGKVVVR